MKNSISKNKKKNVKTIKTKIMETIIKKEKKNFEKETQNLLKRNGISIEMLRYKNFRITKTPIEKFPEMVTITRCVSNFKSFLGKRFINLEKVKVFIDYQKSLYSINNYSRNIQNEILNVVVI